MKQIFFIASLFFTTISFATIIHVPNDYPTIQLAVNNSTQGDTIIVGDGVYTENVQVNIGVNIISENGPENCTFFYSDNICGFTLYSGALISGFWFKGKGRINFNGSGTVRNSIFTDIYDNNCNPYFISVTTTNDINIINCQFRNNYSSCTSYVDDGRGLIIIPTGYAPSVNIDSCVFINNTFNYSTGQGANGGAISIGSPNSTTFISNSQFISNKIVRWGMPKGQGGAIYSNTNNISILNCYFYDNLAEKGSAVYIGWYNNSFSLINSTIENNSNIAIYNISSSNSIVRNCNFTNNMNGIYNDRDNLFFDAEDSWWGHSTGPYHPTSNTAGQGDSVNLYVDVLPFLTTPDTVAPIPMIQNVLVDTFGIDYVDIYWDASPVGDLAGYKIYLGNSAIDVGLDTAYTLSGLTPDEEYSVMVTCYDNSGEESWYSEELFVSPTPISVITTEDTLDFGAVLVGGNARASLLVSNNGTADLRITNITSSATEFEPQIETLLVSPSSQGGIPIIFTPTEFGLVTANLAITSDAYNTPDLVITLIGSGDLSPNPAMLSVVDVPDDQGGQVRVSFSSSKYDGIDTTQQIESYTVWRYIDGTNWDAVEMFNAVQDSVYYYVAPTLCDSTFEGICWSTYKVSAHTHDADVFFWSDSLSGYSVDNIAPAAPTGLLATATDEIIYLTWDTSTEVDFHYFILEKSTDSEFSDFETIHTVDTTYNDTEYEINVIYYYRLTVADYTGNVSDYSEIVEATVLSIDLSGLIPNKFALYQNYPNPFNPITTLRYDLPENSSVKFIIYDLLGREVRTLVNQTQEAGYKSVIWNATNDHGKPVSAGVYLYKIQAGDFRQLRKMILLK